MEAIYRATLNEFNMKSYIIDIIVMRFEVYFRCYRYLGRLLNLFNFIGIINYLWHVDDIYLVSRTPDRMLMHWSRMQMYITYMGMFWGKTLWLDVCVFCGVGSGEPRIPSGDAGVFWILEWNERGPVWDRLARDSHYGLNNIETDPTSYRHLQHTIQPTPIYLWC